MLVYISKLLPIHFVERLQLSITDIQKLLGHSSIRTTQKYIKVYEIDHLKMVSPYDTFLKNTK